MKDYNKTLWEDNITLVDARKLNNIEEQVDSITDKILEVESNLNKNIDAIDQACTAITGEKFNSIDERIDLEIDRLNKKIEVSMLQQEDKENHTIDNSVDGMTTDMIIKGRTLQNLIDVRKMVLGDSSREITFENDIIKFKKAYTNEISYLKVPFLSKPNTTYTIIYDVIKNNVEQPDESKYILYPDGVFGDFNSTMNTFPENGQTGLNKICLNTKSSLFGKFSLGFHRVNIGAEIWIKDLMILEGDWTNKPIPNYFEGIKSFGEEEDKISILSNNKNFFNYNKLTGGKIVTFNNKKCYKYNDNAENFALELFIQ